MSFHSNRLLRVLSLVVVFAMLLSACGAPAAAPSGEAPAAAAEAPAAEAAPVVEEGPFEPASYSAPDCDYGGNFKTIESLDQYTVKFTLCTQQKSD